jgi:hypothetical protein
MPARRIINSQALSLGRQAIAKGLAIPGLLADIVFAAQGSGRLGQGIQSRDLGEVAKWASQAAVSAVVVLGASWCPFQPPVGGPLGRGSTRTRSPHEDISGGPRPKSRGTVSSVRIIERHIRAGTRVGTLLVRAGCRSPDRVRLRDVVAYIFTNCATHTGHIAARNDAADIEVSDPRDTRRGRLSPDDRGSCFHEEHQEGFGGSRRGNRRSGATPAAVARSTPPAGTSRAIVARCIIGR